jgi:hypothetical protein
MISVRGVEKLTEVSLGLENRQATIINLDKGCTDDEPLNLRINCRFRKPLVTVLNKGFAK